MATHSSILAWRMPWTEETGRLQSMGSQSWTQLSDFHFQFHSYLSSLSFNYAIWNNWNNSYSWAFSPSRTHLRTCIYFQQGKIKLYTAISRIQQKRKRKKIHLDHLSDFLGPIHFWLLNSKVNRWAMPPDKNTYARLLAGCCERII